MARLREAACQVLVCDIRLPGLDGEQLFRRALPDLGATPVIFVTAFGEVEQAVRLIRSGADDYVTNPSYSSGVVLEAGGRHLAFYNQWRPHSSLDRRTPDEAHFDRTPRAAAA